MRLRKVFLSTSVSLAAGFFTIAALTPPAGAQVLSIWDGTTGDWQDAAHWSTAGFPDNGNLASNYIAQIDDGDVSLTGPVTLDALDLNGGALNLGTHQLTVLDPVETLIGAAQIDLAGGTFTAANGVHFGPDATVTASGTIDGAVYNAGAITATGDLVLGDTGDSLGYFQKGTLDVGAHHVTLLSSTRSSLSNYQAPGARIDIAGGTLSSPSGFDIDSRINAYGTIEGPVFMRGYAGKIFATGDLTIGDPTSNLGLSGYGEIFASSHTVTLLDSDIAELDQLYMDGGTVHAPNGINGPWISGHGMLDSPILQDVLLFPMGGTMFINGSDVNSIIISATGELVLLADTTVKHRIDTEVGGVLDIGSRNLQVTDTYDTQTLDGTTRIAGGTYSHSGTAKIGTLIGYGTVQAAIGTQTANSRIIAQGPMTLGDALRSDAYGFRGILEVGNGNVTILDMDLAYQRGNVVLAGGSLTVPNGLVVMDGVYNKSISGHGSVLGDVTTGSIITQDGELIFGDASTPGNVVINSTLNGGTQTTSFLGGIAPDLGPYTRLAGGTILSDNGLHFDTDDVFTGFGTLNAPQITGGTLNVENGDLAISAEQLTSTINLPAGRTLRLLSDLVIGDGAGYYYLDGSLDIGHHTLNANTQYGLRSSERISMDGGTFQSNQALQLPAGATFQGYGTLITSGVSGDGTLAAEGGELVLQTPSITSRLTSTPDSTIVLTRDTAFGRSITPPQVTLEGTLIVGPYNLVLKDYTGADLGALTELTGGSINAGTLYPNRMQLGANDVIRGYGSIIGNVEGGHIEVLGGTMTLDMSQYNILSSGSVAAGDTLILSGGHRQFGSNSAHTQWINDGLIDIVGSTLPIFQGALANHGTLRAIAGGGIELEGELDNQGTIQIDGGSFVFAGGSLTSPPAATTVTNGLVAVEDGEVGTGQLLDVASTNTPIQVHGGTVNNTGYQIDVTTAGPWSITGGKVRGGSIVSSSGTWTVANNPNDVVTLTDVNLQTHVYVPQGRLVLNGATQFTSAIDVDGVLALTGLQSPTNLPISQINARDGTVVITGTMDLNGQDLDITGTGHWAMSAGSLSNGRIIAGPDQSFLLRRYAWNTGSNALHSVTLAGGTFEASNYDNLSTSTYVYGRLTLDQATLLLRNQYSYTSTQVYLSDESGLPPGQAYTIDGVGEVRFGTSPPDTYTYHLPRLLSYDSLTLGTDISLAVDGRGQIATNILNQGNGDLLVQGQMRIGSESELLLDVSGDWTNAGTLRMEGGAITQLGSGPASFHNPAGARIEGTGTLDLGAAQTTNAGLVAPGSPIGALLWDGKFAQTQTGTLEIELAGTAESTQHDLLSITAEATLAGSLEVRLAEGFTPALGDTFRFLAASSITGSFDQFVFPDMGDHLAWALSNSGTALTLQVVAAAIPGDLNGDGFVGLADLDILLGNWNQTTPPGDVRADVNGDHYVGLDDLDAVLGNWNTGSLPPANTPLPEPAGLVLWGLAGLGVLKRTIPWV